MCVSKPAGKAQHSSWQEEAEAGVEANADKQRGGQYRRETLTDLLSYSTLGWSVPQYSRTHLWAWLPVLLYKTTTVFPGETLMDLKSEEVHQY